MIVAEYMNRVPNTCHMTFIKARARKDAGTPFYHAEYQTTPLYDYTEVVNRSILYNYIVLNDKQESITWLSGVDWNGWIRRGMAKCLLVINPADFEKLFPSQEQRESMERYIDNKIDG